MPDDRELDFHLLQLSADDNIFFAGVNISATDEGDTSVSQGTIGVIDGTAENDLIDVTYSDVDGESVSNQSDTVLAQEGDDTVVGGHGSDSIEGGSGHDRLYGGSGSNTVLGQDGNDTIRGHHGHDSLIGGDGDDDIRDWSGHSVLDGGSGNDYLKAGDGNDTLIGGSGDDTMVGGRKADTFFFESLYTGNDVITDFELGVDVLVIEDNYINNFMTPEKFLKNFTKIDGNDLLISRFFGASQNPDLMNNVIRLQGIVDDPENQTVQDFTSIIQIGAPTVDPIRSTNGSDIIDGTIEGDSILGQGGSDSLYGNDGNDFIDGGSGRDLINGGSGNDTLFGNTRNDTIHSSWGNDIVDEGHGNDVLVSAAGNDTLTGGRGYDNFTVLTQTSENTVVTDFEIGKDRLSLSEHRVSAIQDNDEARIYAKSILADHGIFIEGDDLYLDLGDGRGIKLIDIKDDEIGEDVEDYDEIFF